MILLGKARARRGAGREVRRRGEVLAGDVRRARGGRRRGRDVEGRPLADQGAHEGDRRAARRRDVRPHVLRAPLARLRRRDLRRRAAARAAVARRAHARRARRRAAGDDQHARDPRSTVPTTHKFAVVAAGRPRGCSADPEVTGVVDVDGVRAKFDGGWGLVRASNTQPALVMRCEADTAERLAEIEA